MTIKQFSIPVHRSAYILMNLLFSTKCFIHVYGNISLVQCPDTPDHGLERPDDAIQHYGAMGHRQASFLAELNSER